MHVRNSAPTSHTAAATRRGPRSTQAERSARSRRALLESAARGLSRYGYGNLVLEDVARDAGYTRGALYHQFKDKEDLTLAVLAWIDETWRREVDEPAGREPDPVAALIALAFWGALEGAVISLAGQAPHDELLAARTAAGVLGLERPPASLQA